MSSDGEGVVTCRQGEDLERSGCNKDILVLSPLAVIYALCGEFGKYPENSIVYCSCGGAPLEESGYHFYFLY